MMVEHPWKEKFKLCEKCKKNKATDIVEVKNQERYLCDSCYIKVMEYKNRLESQISGWED